MISIFCNPYHRAGAIVARIGVNVATIIWSVIVIIEPGGLVPTPYGAIMTRYLPEDAWAWAFLVISLGLLYRVVMQCKPHALGAVGYLALLGLWGFVESVQILVQRPVYPTSLAWVTVGCGCALYAFVANGKRPGGHDVGDR